MCARCARTANCVENLPVFALLVYALRACGIEDAMVDPCAGHPGARIPQSLVHVFFAQTDRVVSVRFALFFIQFLGFCVLIALIAFVVDGRRVLRRCARGARLPGACRTRA